MSAQPIEPETTQDLIHAPLTTFETLTHSLFASISQSGLRSQAQQQAPHISSFLETDLVLAQALATAREHQVNQKLIEVLSAEVLELDEKLRGVWTSLDEAHKELGDIVEEGEKRLKEIESSTKGAVPYQQLLNYASILSGFTSAPPTSKGPIGPDQPAPHWIKPPFPNEEKMRAGRLAERPALERVNPKEPGKSHPKPFYSFIYKPSTRRKPPLAIRRPGRSSLQSVQTRLPATPSPDTTGS